MNENTITLLKKLETLTLEKRELDKEIEELKEQIVPELPVDAKIETGQGVFSVKQKVKWVYTVETQALLSNAKAQQKREEADGTAAAIPGEPFLEYREAK